ncbi:keratin, type I cytoskeletal 20 [Pteronotus mesoamericanus]|uniref:keratin, type I cytoskeletal 20 n=1 Tax=Pteronotus mesoamericanus TaxID=1884717 RepID=UPI0023EAC8A4|nr:keratin, type I cytoskeletal 20 [Pteronotus parnellii mesoamericanus]
MDTRRSLQRSLSSSSQVSVVGTYRKGGMLVGVAPSVYGGAGGHGTRISTTKQVVKYGIDGSRGDLFLGDEKMAMRNLNDRLANYLEKVRSLEQSNTKLEMQIKQWYETNVPSLTRDYSAYYKQIEELQAQIKDAQMQKAQWILKIDNTKLAAEDFRLKYETERGLHLAVEADVRGLAKVAEDLTLHKADLEIQVDELKKELALLKKEHQEEVDSLRTQLGKTVNVELKAAPGLNLGAIMDEMRKKYEALAQENLLKVKEEYEIQIESVQQQVIVDTNELKEAEAEAKKLRQSYQTVEIELQSHLSMKDSLERTLQDVNARYHGQLATIQALLNSLEAQLLQIRTEAERQSLEYMDLLDLKTRLEQEIATYRRLLEGEDTVYRSIDPVSTLEEKIDIKKARKVTTVVQEIVDGKVVSSQVKEMEENM